MPTYVYECRACNTTFEAEQRIVEPPLDTCVCGAKGTVKRVIQPVGIAFKGSGFYVNDSVSASSKPSETKPESSAPAESAPAPAPDAKASE